MDRVLLMDCVGQAELWQRGDLDLPVLTEDLEVDGRILLAGLVLSDADVLGLVVLVHLPDGQLRAVVAEEVLLLLILYLLPVPAGHRNVKDRDLDYRAKRLTFN